MIIFPLFPVITYSQLVCLNSGIIPWEISLTCDSLQTNTWVNLGSKPASDINGFVGGDAESTSTVGGGTLPALCFDNEDALNQITYINYNTNSANNPELTMEIWIKPSAQGNKD